MHLGNVAGQDHLSCRAPHLKEIGRQGGKTTEYKLVERKVIVADKTHILPYLQTTRSHLS